MDVIEIRCGCWMGFVWLRMLTNNRTLWNNHEIYTKSREFLELAVALGFPIRTLFHDVYLLRHFRARGIAFQTETLNRVFYLVPTELEKRLFWWLVLFFAQTFQIFWAGSLKVGHDRFSPRLDAIDTIQRVRRNSSKIQHCGVWLLLSAGRHGDVSEHFKVGASPLARCNCAAAAAAATWIARLRVIIATISLTPIVGKSLLCESWKSIELNYCGWISIIRWIIIHSWSVSLLVCLFLCPTASVFRLLLYRSFISLFLCLSLGFGTSTCGLLVTIPRGPLRNSERFRRGGGFILLTSSKFNSFLFIFSTRKLLLPTVTWSVAGAVLLLIVIGIIQ